MGWEHYQTADHLEREPQIWLTKIFQIGTLNPHGINERFSFNSEFIVLFFTLPGTNQ